MYIAVKSVLILKGNEIKKKNIIKYIFIFIIVIFILYDQDCVKN